MRVEYFRKIIKESFIIVILSSLLGIFSGSILSSNQGILYSFPVILLLLPSLNSLVGDISTVLVSRISTHLYIGIIPSRLQKSRQLKEDFISLLLTILLGLGALIFIGYLMAYSTNIEIVNPFIIIIILLMTILILFSTLFMLLFICSIFLFNRGRDPNNLLIPAVTSLADFLTPFLIISFITIFI